MDPDNFSLTNATAMQFRQNRFQVNAGNTAGYLICHGTLTLHEERHVGWRTEFHYWIFTRGVYKLSLKSYGFIQ